MLRLVRKMRRQGWTHGMCMERLLAVAPDMRAELARGIATVYNTQAVATPREKLLPCLFMADMFKAGGTFTLPPVPTDPKEQRAAFLSAVFAPGDIVAFCALSGDIRSSLLLRVEAAMRPEAPEAELVLANPVDGREHLTKDGHPSLVAESCLTSFQNYVVEFDEGLTVEEQLQLWKGVIATKALPVAALVHSGNKSVHGIIRSRKQEGSGESPLEAWRQGALELKRLFTAPDCHCDYAVLASPCRRTRLAGAFRADKGRVQQLLYVAQPTTYPPSGSTVSSSPATEPTPMVSRADDLHKTKANGNIDPMASFTSGVML